MRTRAARVAVKLGLLPEAGAFHGRVRGLPITLDEHGELQLRVAAGPGRVPDDLVQAMRAARERGVVLSADGFSWALPDGPPSQVAERVRELASLGQRVVLAAGPREDMRDLLQALDEAPDDQVACRAWSEFLWHALLERAPRLPAVVVDLASGVPRKVELVVRFLSSEDGNLERAALQLVREHRHDAAFAVAMSQRLEGAGVPNGDVALDLFEADLEPEDQAVYLDALTDYVSPAVGRQLLRALEGTHPEAAARHLAEDAARLLELPGLPHRDLHHIKMAAVLHNPLWRALLEGVALQHPAFLIGLAASEMRQRELVMAFVSGRQPRGLESLFETGHHDVRVAALAALAEVGDLDSHRFLETFTSRWFIAPSLRKAAREALGTLSHRLGSGGLSVAGHEAGGVSETTPPL